MRRPKASFVLLALAALGCGRIEEVKRCRKLAALVNPTLDDIAARAQKDQGAATYHYAAARYGKVARELKGFDVGIPRAERAVDDLATAFQEASTQSEKLAHALDRKDAVVTATARRELGQLARLQRAIVMRVGAECGG